jgi:soluble lytic murein transglycosylase-like protein
MKIKHFWATAVALLLLIMIGLAGVFAAKGESPDMRASQRFLLHRAAPVSPSLYTSRDEALITVAKVYGKDSQCANSNYAFIQETADTAIENKLDPGVLAGTVVTESKCDPLAVSDRGAVGLMQIMVKIHAQEFDFSGNVNLFNREDNLRAGAKILSTLIKAYGTENGLARYQGLGVSSASYNPNYTAQIMKLAGQ